MDTAEEWRAWALEHAPGETEGCNDVTLQVRIQVALANLRFYRDREEMPSGMRVRETPWRFRITTDKAGTP